MNLRPEKKGELDLNLTPLIDVVFLLLIFFMVSTTFERRSEINITLPKASPEYTEKNLDAVNVAVDAKGRVFVNDHSLINSRMITIREAIRDAARDIDKPTVIIDADAQATHQSVVKIMDAARQLGLVKITFTTQELDDDETLD